MSCIALMSTLQCSHLLGTFIFLSSTKTGPVCLLLAKNYKSAVICVSIKWTEDGRSCKDVFEKEEACQIEGDVGPVDLYDLFLWPQYILRRLYNLYMLQCSDSFLQTSNSNLLDWQFIAQWPKNYTSKLTHVPHSFLEKKNQNKTALIEIITPFYYRLYENC